MSPPAIGPDGSILVDTLGANRPRVVHAVAPDGRLRWRTRLPKGIGDLRRPAVGADGTIYGAEVGGTVHALNPDGSMLWSMPLNRRAVFSAPAIGPDGSVVLLDSHLDTQDYVYEMTVRAIGPGPEPAGAGEP